MPYVKIHMTYYLKVINYYTVSLYRAVIRNVYVNAPSKEKWHMMLNNSMHGSSNEILWLSQDVALKTIWSQYNEKLMSFFKCTDLRWGFCWGWHRWGKYSSHSDNKRRESDWKTKLQNVLFCELEILGLRLVAYLTVVHYYKLTRTGLGACVPPVMFLIARFCEDRLWNNSKRLLAITQVTWRGNCLCINPALPELPSDCLTAVALSRNRCLLPSPCLRDFPGHVRFWSWRSVCVAWQKSHTRTHVYRRMSFWYMTVRQRFHLGF